MIKKITAVTLLVLQMLTAMSFAAADMTMLDKTAAVESALYGAVQTGALVDRADAMEKDLFGTVSKDSLVNKIDKAYTYTIENSSSGPSLIVKMNSVEWTLTRGITGQAIKTRLENVERMINGNAGSGSIDARMNKLLKTAFPAGTVVGSNGHLDKDSLIKIKLTSPLDTKTNRAGDIVNFQVAEDVFADGLLVIPQGAAGQGKVLKVEPRKNFGRDAKIEVSFDTVQAIDGSMLKTVLGDKAKKETQSLATAAGASVAGMIILGPIGVVGGAFVNGKDVTIPAGSELYIQTQSELELYGIQVK